MKHVLLFGAGKSSSHCIQYLNANAKANSWKVKVADLNTNHAQSIFSKAESIEFVNLNIIEESIIRKKLVLEADIVLSLLPPDLHYIVAQDCLEFKRNLITASYVSDKIKALHEEVKAANLLFMCEMGLDPGIDHMSTMKVIDEIERVGGHLDTYISCCGGLVAPESDNNPWHYKISWNPKNVVLAAKSGAKFKRDNATAELSYPQIFANYQLVDIPGLGKLAYYANRDSVIYEELYGIKGVKNLLRATLRYPAFMLGWKKIVEWGLTDEDDQVDTSVLSTLEWIAQKNNIEPEQVKAELSKGQDSNNAIELILMFTHLQLLKEEKLNIGTKSSAEILQHLLEKNLKMMQQDKDMIVMHHYFEYFRKEIKTQLYSTLIVKGEDSVFTAMSKTVGLPMAILAKLLLTDKVKNISGVRIPTHKKVYEPVLKELRDYGIIFDEIAI